METDEVVEKVDDAPEAEKVEEPAEEKAEEAAPAEEEASEEEEAVEESKEEAAEESQEEAMEESKDDAAEESEEKEDEAEEEEETAEGSDEDGKDAKKSRKRNSSGMDANPTTAELILDALEDTRGSKKGITVATPLTGRYKLPRKAKTEEQNKPTPTRALRSNNLADLKPKKKKKKR